MPTIITHSIVAGSSAWGFSFGKGTFKFWILSVLCSSLPDADVIGYRWLYIPYSHFFGHRGFFSLSIFRSTAEYINRLHFLLKKVIFSKQW